MSPFEYHIALVSVVVGLAIAHALSGLLKLIHSRASVRWDWIPLAWTLSIIFWTVHFWWFTFFRSQVESPLTLHLLFVIAYAAALYLLLGLLYPHDISAGFDMRSRFQENRVWFFSVLLAFGFLDFVDTIWGLPISGSPPLTYWFLLAIWVLGSGLALIVEGRRYHAGFAIVVALLFGLQATFNLDTFELRVLYPGG